MSRERIIIIGAGVVGLDVALCLAERGHGKRITVVAQHLPGDTSINYTSPWAGANFSAISGSDLNALRWDKNGYNELRKMAKRFGKSSMIKETPSLEYWDQQPSKDKTASMQEYLQDFRVLTQEERPSGTEFGVAFTTLTINAPEHVKWLEHRLETEYGVQFERRRVDRVRDAFSLPGVSMVFNYIGNTARVMPNVQDEKCFPTRSQILLAKAPQITQNTMRHGSDYETYIIPRPSSNGKVVLGGFMQKGNDSPDTYGSEAQSILERTHELVPALNSSETDVLASFAGLRPSREGGARVEKEIVELDGRLGEGILVHNYGAGGTGFQAGLGMA